HIIFKNVSFEYEPGRPVLHGIDLEVRAGETIAIVGASGAGKTTLVSLLPRLYDPTEGAVLIDGEDIRSYTVASLRAQIGVVLQEALLLSGTSKDNVALGRATGSHRRQAGRGTGAQLTHAIELAGAAGLLARLPQGWDTPVAERGSTLSGGEKQRIAIARAI